MDLTAPPLVPLAALALASSGQLGPGAPPPEGPRAAPAPAAVAPAPVLTGETLQKLPVSIRLRGRRASWRIGYVARCDDGTVVRGRYVSGRGTPPLVLGRGGRFRVTGDEPAQFDPEGTGRARFEISGRLGSDGGNGTWRLTLVTPPGEGGSVACTVGPLTWRVRGA